MAKTITQEEQIAYLIEAICASEPSDLSTVEVHSASLEADINSRRATEESKERVRSELLKLPDMQLAHYHDWVKAKAKKGLTQAVCDELVNLSDQVVTITNKQGPLAQSTDKLFATIDRLDAKKTLPEQLGVAINIVGAMASFAGEAIKLAGTKIKEKGQDNKLIHLLGSATYLLGSATVMAGQIISTAGKIIEKNPKVVACAVAAGAAISIAFPPATAATLSPIAASVAFLKLAQVGWDAYKEYKEKQGALNQEIEDIRFTLGKAIKEQSPDIQAQIANETTNMLADAGVESTAAQVAQTRTSETAQAEQVAYARGADDQTAASRAEVAEDQSTQQDPQTVIAGARQETEAIAHKRPSIVEKIVSERTPLLAREAAQIVANRKATRTPNPIAEQVESRSESRVEQLVKSPKPASAVEKISEQRKRSQDIPPPPTRAV